MSNIIKYNNILPQIDNSSFIAPNATISGDVKIGKNSGIWYGTVIRGDVAKIKIGNYTNIQDNSVIHVTRANHVQNKTNDEGGPTIIGDYVTIGHNAIIHACTIKDYSFIGMGAIIMDLAIIEENSMIAAGAVVTPGKIVKSGQIWAGNPAKYFRDLTQEEIDYIKISAMNYWDLAKEYKD
ncbi:gamma carbonic anhydrase family protein [Rickettsiales bacterium]|nr:gamma carbonic anhydrase family protein [Rickettsiales bacterium]MDB2550900.1 gamma carbonic anhydrase family protein [Rickettsiales bacterium]